MEEEIKIELIDLIQNFFARMIILESQQYIFQNDDYSTLFRYLHNFKGTFSMLGVSPDINNLIHTCEDHLVKNEKKNKISLIDYNFIYQSVEQIENYLNFGDRPKSPEIIEKCIKCQASHTKHLSMSCTIGHIPKMEEQYNPNSDSIAETKVQNKNPNILLISNNRLSCPLTTNLNENKILYKKLNCLNDIYQMGSDLNHFKVIMINLENLAMPFSLSLRVLHVIHKKCMILVYGDKKNDEYSHDESDLTYYWLGKNSFALESTLKLLLSKVT